MKQREVLQWIAQGYSLPCIAANLNRSVKTIECHAAACRHKLGVHNTTDLVIEAIRRHLVWVEGVGTV